MAWEFRRNGPGAPDDANSVVSFAAEPGEGTATILPANFALVGLGTAVDWNNVEFDTASLNLYLGDFNGDGSVNHCDLALWIPHAASAAGDGAFDAEFDLNADARVDSSDLSLLMPRLYQPVLGDAQAPAWAASAHLAPASQATGCSRTASRIALRHTRVAAPPSRNWLPLAGTPPRKPIPNGTTRSSRGGSHKSERAAPHRRRWIA